jgi:hypothetical protein
MRDQTRIDRPNKSSSPLIYFEDRFLRLSFGMLGTGVVTTDIGIEDWGFGVAQQPWDGKIVVAGYSRVTQRDITLARYWP